MTMDLYDWLPNLTDIFRKESQKIGSLLLEVTKNTLQVLIL
jgi:hypothetical protein